MPKYKLSKEKLGTIIDEYYAELYQQLGVRAFYAYDKDKHTETLSSKNAGKIEKLRLSTVLVGLPNGEIGTKQEALKSGLTAEEVENLPCIYNGVALGEWFIFRSNAYRVPFEWTCRNTVFDLCKQTVRELNDRNGYPINPDTVNPTVLLVFGESDDALTRVSTNVGVYNYAKIAKLTDITEDTPLAKAIELVEPKVGKLLYTIKLSTPEEIEEHGNPFYISLKGKSIDQIIQEYLENESVEHVENGNNPLMVLERALLTAMYERFANKEK